MNEILEKINGKLIVSCQANEEINPFHSPEEMLKMAQAGKIGGCVGFRANKPENVKIIKEAFPDMPMIGIWKVVTEGCDVYITPTMKEVDVLREIGSDIIAVDGTDRKCINVQIYCTTIRQGLQEIQVCFLPWG